MLVFAFQLTFVLNVDELRVVNTDGALESLLPYHFVDEINRLLRQDHLVNGSLGIDLGVNKLHCVVVRVAHRRSDGQDLSLGRGGGLKPVEARAGDRLGILNLNFLGFQCLEVFFIGDLTSSQPCARFRSLALGVLLGKMVRLVRETYVWVELGGCSLDHVDVDWVVLVEGAVAP